MIITEQHMYEAQIVFNLILERCTTIGVSDSVTVVGAVHQVLVDTKDQQVVMSD